MTTQATLDLINLALASAQEAPLSSLTEKRKAAILAGPSFDMERRALLRRARWQFAKRRAVLAPLAAAPAFGFRYQHLLPADFVAVIGAYPDAESARVTLTGAEEPYQIEGNALLIDLPVVYLLYLVDVTDPNAFDPLFSKALIEFLGARFALQLKNDDGLADMLTKAGASQLREARRAGAIENPGEQVVTNGAFAQEGRFDEGPANRRPGFYR